MSMTRTRRLGIGIGSLILLGVIFFLLTRNGLEQNVNSYEPYTPNPEVEQKVVELLAKMTLEEKIGQMLQVERAGITLEEVTNYHIGSILSGGGSAPDLNTPEGWANMFDEFQQAALATRLQIPILYGVDAVHGHNNVPNATIFPHNIGLGATRDIALAERIGAVVAKEVRATGVNWTFAPCLCVPIDERWGRTYEGFSEDPQLTAELGTAFVRGYQNSANPIIATLKHWVGDGATTGGVDQGLVEMPEDQLRRYMEPYKPGIEAGARAVMVSYSSWNGLKTHGDSYLITDVLKGELGFNGIVISDYNGVDQVHPEYKEAIKQSVNAGIDMIMVANVWKPLHEYLLELVNENEIPMTRIDDAVTRILRVKFESGVFEQPYANRELVAAGVVGSDEHRALAREAVRKSLVLLKNDQELLPIASEKQKVFVAGARADDIGVQSGGWTVFWQGGKGKITRGTTILEGIQNAMTDRGTVTYHPNGEGVEGHDIAIVVVGEDPYAEYRGDKLDLSLNGDEIILLEKIQATGVPTVVILLSGRPMIITDQLEASDAFVAAWLPGPS